MRRLALAAAAALAAGGGARAGEPIWPDPATERRMPLAEEAAPFQGVGRLNIAGARFCTATLVSETEVLTAAHCLFHPRTGKPAALGEMRFVAGHRIDRNAGVRTVLRAAIAPGFALVGNPGPADLRGDVALLELDAPIWAARAFAVGPFLEDDPAPMIVSYARDRAQAPSITERCPALGGLDAVLVLGCAVERGVSGAPVFVGEGARARLVAVVAAMGRLPDGGAFALAPLAAPWIATLRADLAAQAREAGGAAD